ncbi:MAG TPA: phosphoglucomutase/phosphomannomutase family protein [Bacillota bacterium]
MIRFGTGGWRAIIGDDFIKENIIRVADALAWKMTHERSVSQGIVIGYDKRFLSDKASRWVAEVFAAYGIKVHFIGKVTPTPVVMYTVKQYHTSYGLTITASHNPADYNGIKIFTYGGKDADVEVTRELEEIIEARKGATIPVMDFDAGIKSEIIRIINPLNDYLDTIMKMLDVKSIREKSLRILLDPMFGVSKVAIQTILQTCRCEVDVIHDQHDTTFGGRMPSPTEDTLRHLKSMVIERKYDLGIGTDGDGDRLGIIDENGTFINPNKIMSMLYYYFLKYKNWKGPVVRNIATTHLLDRIAAKFGESCYEVPVGFKYISSKMMETNALIGGESSGGLTIRGHIHGKDSIFSACLLVEMMSVTNLKLGEMLEQLDREFGTFVMVEKNLSFNQTMKHKINQQIMIEHQIPNFAEPIEKISYLDGVKVYFRNGGWLVARFSGTEPLLRIFAEMSTKAEAQEVIDCFEQFLELE